MYSLYANKSFYKVADGRQYHNRKRVKKPVFSDNITQNKSQHIILNSNTIFHYTYVICCTISLHICVNSTFYIYIYPNAYSIYKDFLLGNTLHYRTS